MNKQPSALQYKINKVLDKFERGELKSGSGYKVMNRKQALAIGYSEARKLGYN